MHKTIKLIILTLGRALGLFALARRLTACKVRILCYHGGNFGDERHYNPKLFCSASMLRQRMQWLQSKGFDLVTLDQAVERASAEPTGRTALSTAVTFDDGWYSTASQLVPVLAGLGIPSTLYLCTSHYLEGWSVPSVSIRYLIWKSRLQSAHLAGLGAADGFADFSTIALRNASVARIVRAMEALAPTRAARHAALEQLAACLHLPAAALALGQRRFEYVNQMELRSLPAMGCRIELHGHVHRYPGGDVHAFRNDLQRCSDTIVAAGLPQPVHYCYPSGEFDAGAAATLASAGVVSATTCVPGLVTRAHGWAEYYLPRFLDGGSVTMLEFQAEMSGVYDLARALRAALRDCRPAILLGTIVRSPRAACAAAVGMHAGLTGRYVDGDHTGDQPVEGCRTEHV